MKYTFIRDHGKTWPVRWLYRMLEVHPSGYYAWRHQSRSARSKADERLTGLIKQFWLESGGVYGYRKIHSDARADVVDCIEMFYNSRRRHGFNHLLSPVEYERRFTERLRSV